MRVILRAIPAPVQRSRIPLPLSVGSARQERRGVIGQACRAARARGECEAQGRLRCSPPSLANTKLLRDSVFVALGHNSDP